MCHIKNIFKNSIKIENIENIGYLRTKTSDIYRYIAIYIEPNLSSTQTYQLYQTEIPANTSYVLVLDVVEYRSHCLRMCIFE